MAIVTAWVVGLIWVVRQATQRVAFLAPVARFLPWSGPVKQRSGSLSASPVPPRSASWRP